MSLMPDISHTAFDLLIEGAAADGFHVRESDVVVAAGNVMHGLDGQRRLLLVPLDDAETEFTDEVSQGVVLRPRHLDDAGKVRRFQTLVCELPRLNSPFEAFCDEVLEALLEHPEEPAARCVEVLERWRELLEPRKKRLLGANALSGLLAELHLLEQVLAESDPGTALALWTGPSAARFDFMGPRQAAEVKATTSRDDFKVTIHGLLQLDPPPGTELLLIGEQVEQVPSGGDSVPEALDRLVASGMSRAQLLLKLNGLDVSPDDLDTYRHIRFRTTDVRAFQIGPDFPRLVPSSLADPRLADRLHRVTYAVDLGDAAILGRLSSPADVARYLLMP